MTNSVGLKVTRTKDGQLSTTTLVCLDQIYLFVDGKDGPDGDEAVNIGGAVQRIKAHNVFSLEDKEEH